MLLLFIYIIYIVCVIPYYLCDLSHTILPSGAAPTGILGGRLDASARHGLRLLAAGISGISGGKTMR